MYFGLSEDQRLLQDSVRKFCEAQVSLDVVRRVAESNVFVEREAADAIHHGLAELGLYAILVPEAQGGLGLGVLEAALVQEVLGRYVVPCEFTATQLAARALAETDYLGGLLDGSMRVALALAPQGEASEATLADGKLKGRASFVWGAAGATHILVQVESGFALVEANADNVTRQPLATIDTTRSFAALAFDSCDAVSITADASRLTEAGCVLLAADIFGASEMMLEKAVAYAQERKQFNRVIGSFQAVKHMCAEMAAMLEPCRALMWYAAYALDTQDDEAALVARLAKARLSDVGQSIARTATEVHGGMGFTDLLGLHYWFKRIGANRLMLGGPEATRAEAAQLQGWG